MTDKIQIKPEQVVSRKGGYISYYDEGNTLRKTKASNVAVLGEGQEPAAQPEAPVSPEGQPLKNTITETVSTTPAAPPAADQSGPASSPAPGVPQPKPSKRGNKTKETADMATTKAKSKSAPKKKASAGKTRPISDKPAGVRTIGGKPVDVSSYVKAKAPGGGTSLNNGDAVAEKLQGKELDQVYEIVAKALKVEVKELKSKYGKLNVGMQRMNLGNRLRKVQMPKAARS